MNKINFKKYSSNSQLAGHRKLEVTFKMPDVGLYIFLKAYENTMKKLYTNILNNIDDRIIFLKHRNYHNWLKKK